MSITSISLSKSSFNHLPIEIISNYIRPYLTYQEACVISRTSRCFQYAFNSCEEHCNMRDAVAGSANILKKLLIKHVESLPVTSGIFNPNRDDPKYVFALRRIPGDKVHINLTCPYRQIAAQNDKKSNGWVELKIEAIYKSNLLLGLPEVVFHEAYGVGTQTINLAHEGNAKSNSPDIMEKIAGCAQSYASVFGIWAILPIFIPSEFIARVIKSNVSKISLLGQFNVELIPDGQIPPADQDFVHLCVLKLKYVLNNT